MIFLQTENLIEEKLCGRYENFLMYCKEAGKNFVEELDAADFVAYRAEYSATREEVAQIKNLLNFQVKNSVEKVLPKQNISDALKNSLKNFFNVADITPHKNILVDEFLKNAAINKESQINLIIAALEKFSLSVKTKYFFLNLPDEIKNKRVCLFLRAYKVYEKSIPENLTLAELPDYLGKNSLSIDINLLKKFVQNFIDFDVRACAKKIATAPFQNKRGLEVVLRRAEGKTLDAIGKEFKLTRERVRQIESKATKKFAASHADCEKIFRFIYVMTDGKSFITVDDVKKFIDEIVAKIIWFFAAKIDSQIKNFHFDQESNTVVLNAEKIFDENEILKNLPAIMDEENFNAAINRLAQEKNISAEFVKFKLEKFYRRNGKFFHRDRLTFKFKFEYILKERFPNGYKIDDEISYSRFMRYLQEIFDEKTPLAQRNVDSKIGTFGVLCGRGKYIHADFVHVPDEIIKRVKNFIDNSKRTALFYKEIFETLKNDFIGTQITNHYFLQGVIKLYKLPYILRKDYLTKSGEMTTDKEFEKFVAERGEVTAQEIKFHFVSFTDYNISFLLTRCREVINIGGGKYLHISRLNVQNSELERIKNFLNQNCAAPVNARFLIDLFFENFADFMSRNEIYTPEKLFGILQYLFRDEFNFSRPYISTADIKSITNKKVLLNLLDGVEKIKIEDVIEIAEENGIHFTAKTYLVDSLQPDFIRVDEINLTRPESIGVTD